MRAVLPRLEHLLETEGEIVITRRGKPVARILPTAPEGGIPSRVALRRQMDRLDIGSEESIRGRSGCPRLSRISIRARSPRATSTSPVPTPPTHFSAPCGVR
jgi:antitoxin (DNA-binding transcriptional repressor) of toxin-antitoxin stability system